MSPALSESPEGLDEDVNALGLLDTSHVTDPVAALGKGASIGRLHEGGDVVQLLDGQAPRDHLLPHDRARRDERLDAVEEPSPTRIRHGEGIDRRGWQRPLHAAVAHARPEAPPQTLLADAPVADEVRLGADQGEVGEPIDDRNAGIVEGSEDRRRQLLQVVQDERDVGPRHLHQATDCLVDVARVEGSFHAANDRAEPPGGLAERDLVIPSDRLHEIAGPRRRFVLAVANGEGDYLVAEVLEQLRDAEHVPFGPARDEIAIVDQADLHAPAALLSLIGHPLCPMVAKSTTGRDVQRSRRCFADWRRPGLRTNRLLQWLHGSRRPACYQCDKRGRV